MIIKNKSLAALVAAVLLALGAICLPYAARPLQAQENMGKCEWTDINGNPRCNSPWSRFQCQQAGGTFTEGGTCP